MFREMRRKKQLLSNEESIDILKNSTSGVLAVLGDEDYPYTVPLSHLYFNDKIYFHVAKPGHKNDAIKKSNKASYCIIHQDKIVPEEYNTYFKSVVVFGKINVVKDKDEKVLILQKLGEKYHPQGSIEDHNKEIKKDYDYVEILEMSIEHITGKQSLDLVEK